MAISKIENASLATSAVGQSNMAAGVAGTGPAFSAYCTGTQSFANVTFTKLVFNAEEFDTANCYDSTTNYRFTPNVAGYYQVNGLFLFNNMTGGTELGLYKNGTAVKYGLYPNKVAGESVYACINTLVYMNGTTDYLELYGYQTSGGSITSIAGSSNTTYFQAFLARAA